MTAAGLVPKMQDQPIKVKEPVAGSPADRAGLKANDQDVFTTTIELGN